VQTSLTECSRLFAIIAFELLVIRPESMPSAEITSYKPRTCIEGFGLHLMKQSGRTIGHAISEAQWTGLRVSSRPQGWSSNSRMASRS
jgi:hypothetical protein